MRYIIKAILAWGPDPVLEELSLTQSNIPNILCGQLLKALSPCKQLVHICLAGNPIGLHGFHLTETINTWGPDPVLKTLDLTDCSMPTPVCGNLLSALGRCKNLTDLLLPHFLSEPLQRLPSLEELFLSYTGLNRRDLIPTVASVRRARSGWK